jgi:hypothetical protein
MAVWQAAAKIRRSSEVAVTTCNLLAVVTLMLEVQGVDWRGNQVGCEVGSLVITILRGIFLKIFLPIFQYCC